MSLVVADQRQAECLATSYFGRRSRVGAVVVAAAAPATKKERAPASVIDALDLPQIIHSRA